MQKPVLGGKIYRAFGVHILQKKYAPIFMEKLGIQF
jgi:hypothetical protein